MPSTGRPVLHDTNETKILPPVHSFTIFSRFPFFFFFPCVAVICLTTIGAFLAFLCTTFQRGIAGVKELQKG